MYKVKHSRELKILRKQFERLSATLQKSLLVLQSEKLVFTRIFWGQMNPRATSLATTFASPDSELLGTSPTHKSKEKSLVLNNKAVPSPATVPKFDRQKASTRIGKKDVDRCYCFCDSFVVAKWLYRSYPQGGRAMKAWCDFFVQEKRKFFVSNKEFENENKFVSRIVLNWFTCCKSGFFLMVKAHG